MSELNESVTFTVGSSTTLSVPVDATLTIEGQAADAAAVGRALAGKQDAGSVVISVNGQAQDNQGQIEITGEDVPVNGTEGAESIADAVAALQARTGADIPLSGSTADTIGAKIAEMDGQIAAAAGKTAADITYDGTAATPETIKAHVDALGTTVNGIGARTAADIVYDGTAATPETIKAHVDALKATVDGIGTENVKYTQGQGLDDTHKGYARENIGAAAAADVAAIQASMTGKLADVLPYQVLELSGNYPLPLVERGLAERLGNSCALYRFGPLVLVTYCFKAVADIPAGTRLAGFYGGYEPMANMLVIAQITGPDGTLSHALYRDGEGVAASSVLPADPTYGTIYRGFILYGLNSTLWPVST